MPCSTGLRVTESLCHIGEGRWALPHEGSDPVICREKRGVGRWSLVGPGRCSDGRELGPARSRPRTETALVSLKRQGVQEVVPGGRPEGCYF